MKKQISEYIKSLGGTTEYSGNTKTMYINDPVKDGSMESIESVIYNVFGLELPFTLKTN